MGKRAITAVIIAVLIISVVSLSTISAEQNYNLPAWIKNNAKWWGEGQVSDADFISGMKYLIENNIIEISTTVKVSDEYFQEYKDWAHREIDKFKTFSEKLKDEKNDLNSENIKLQRKTQKLENQLANTKNQYSELYDTYLSLYEGQSEFRSKVERYTEEVQEYFEVESLKPKTIIYEQKVNWYVSDSKGNQYSWSMPIETYEFYVRVPEPLDTLRLNNPDTGDLYTVKDHTKFVRTSFTNIIDGVYDNSKSDFDFAYEIWYIVSQLTTYSYDIGEDPRWALETLSRGGGDCEDTTILIADMLKSSKHTKDWEIKLVYFDAYNPQNPQGVNHIAVSINDGERNYILESTVKDTPYHWKDGVKGWYFDI